MIRDTVLFTPDGKAAVGLIRLWRDRGATQPLLAGSRVLEQDRSASRYFRSLWAACFPGRPLPFGALGQADGRGTTLFWDVFDA